MNESFTEVTPAPPAGGGAGVSPEEAEFKERVDRILGMMQDDPAVRDRVLVELYVTIAEFKAQFDEALHEMQTLGPKGLFKMMRGG